MSSPTLQDKIREAQSKGASPSELLLFELKNDQDTLLLVNQEIETTLERIDSKEPISSQLAWGITADITDTTPTIVLPALEELSYVITSITISNSSDSVGTWVNILDGKPAIYTVYMPPNTQGLYSGVKIKQAEPNKDILVQCETSGANVRASVSGYTE
jgi:hypothetical protein